MIALLLYKILDLDQNNLHVLMQASLVFIYVFFHASSVHLSSLFPVYNNREVTYPGSDGSVEQAM